MIQIEILLCKDLRLTAVNLNSSECRSVKGIRRLVNLHLDSGAAQFLSQGRHLRQAASVSSRQPFSSSREQHGWILQAPGKTKMKDS